MHIRENEEVIIFKNDKDYYSIGLSRKDRNNQVYYGYFPCQFKKGVSVENKTRIKLKNAFISFYLKENETKSYLMICDFEEIKQKENYAKIKDDMENNESELPF